MIHDIVELDRPIISLDLETPGLFPNIDRIVQIGIVKVYPDGKITEWQSFIDPGMPIPKHVTEIHHIGDDHVKEAPLFEQIADKLLAGFEGSDFTGYNVKNFDLKFISAEFARCGKTFKPGRVVDAFIIYKKYNPRNLTNAVYSYLQEEHPDAHSALADAKASIRVLHAQLLRHQELPRTIEELEKILAPNGNFVDSEGKFVWGSNGKAVLNFGQRAGQLLEKCDASYLQWITRSNFNEEVKTIARNALSGKFPVKA